MYIYSKMSPIAKNILIQSYKIFLLKITFVYIRSAQPDYKITYASEFFKEISKVLDFSSQILIFITSLLI